MTYYTNCELTVTNTDTEEVVMFTECVEDAY